MAAASSRRKRPNSITNLLGDVLDDAKELADDALDRAGDLERDAHRTARRVVDARGRSLDDGTDARGADATDTEVDSLKAAIDDLTAKVNRLANLQADSTKRPR